MNTETSILGTQYTMTVTFDRSILSMTVILGKLKLIQMSQNGKLLNLTTKAMIKWCMENSKKSTLLFIHVPVHDGNTIIKK